nr:MAG TPA: hypothetical protein [Crassvirales sp.]
MLRCIYKRHTTITRYISICIHQSANQFVSLLYRSIFIIIWDVFILARNT